MKRAALLALVLAACGEAVAPPPPPPPPPPPSPVGSYTLAEVQGIALPFTILDTNGRPLATLVVGALNIRDGGLYSSSLTVRDELTGASVVGGGAGSWTSQGTNITITPNDGSCVDHGTFQEASRSLTIPNDCDLGLQYYFTR